MRRQGAKVRGQAIVEYSILAFLFAMCLIAGPFVPIPSLTGGGKTTLVKALYDAYQVYTNSYNYQLTTPYFP